MDATESQVTMEMYAQSLGMIRPDSESRQVDVYHHRGDDGPKINSAVEKNSKGYNYSATVTGARSPEEAIALIAQTLQHLRDLLGEEVQL